jgi:hypothetical protein
MTAHCVVLPVKWDHRLKDDFSNGTMQEAGRFQRLSGAVVVGGSTTLGGEQWMTNSDSPDLFSLTKSMRNAKKFIPALIEFVKDDNGKFNPVVLHQGEHDMKAPRK